jgi:hypothetical protein
MKLARKYIAVGGWRRAREIFTQDNGRKIRSLFCFSKNNWDNSNQKVSREFFLDTRHDDCGFPYVLAYSLSPRCVRFEDVLYGIDHGIPHRMVPMYLLSTVLEYVVIRVTRKNGR